MDDWGNPIDESPKKTDNIDGWGQKESSESFKKPETAKTNTDDGWGTGSGGWGSSGGNDNNDKGNGQADNGWGNQPSGGSPRKFNDNWGGGRGGGGRGRGRGGGGGRWDRSNDNDRPPRRDNYSRDNSNRDGGSRGFGGGDRFKNNDDGWGSSTNDDAWGSGSSSSKPVGESGSKNDDGWGTGGSVAWGSSSSSNNNSRPNNKRGNDSWGGNNDWGSGSKGDEQKSSNDGWGASNNDDDGGQSRKRFRKDNDGNQDGKNDNQEERPAPYKPEALDLEEEARMQAETGSNFEHYLTQKVTCLPPDAIKPIESFSDAISSKLLLDNIKASKYTAMTPIQKWAIPTILAGYDIIGCAQTGSGKTAAFLLPVLQTILRMDNIDMPDPNSNCQNPYCLVISPTRELARQTHIAASILSRDSIVKTQVIYGQIATAHLKSKLCEGCHILVATPGKLKDFLERGWIGFKNIKYVILDEGDRLCDDGFQSDVKLFFSHETMPPKEFRQTLFFSATFKEEVQMVAREFLKDDFIFLTVGRIGAANENIKQEFLQIPRHEKKRELKKLLAEIPEEDKTIIFTQTKQAADLLAGFFNGLNLSSTSIHGDRHQSQREQAINAFKRGEKRFLISSPVGNRGLDLPKVALVINYDLPNNIDEYVHRIGRTGRAGHTGRAISFCDVDRDAELLPHLVKILEEAKQDVPSWMRGDGSSGFGSGGFGESTNEGPAPESDFPAGSSIPDEDWG